MTKSTKKRNAPARQRGSSANWQYGALPFRLDPEFRILLMTSRRTKRWGDPKRVADQGAHAACERRA